jgi:hypothetical protein
MELSTIEQRIICGSVMSIEVISLCRFDLRWPCFVRWFRPAHREAYIIVMWLIPGIFWFVVGPDTPSFKSQNRKEAITNRDAQTTYRTLC